MGVLGNLAVFVGFLEADENVVGLFGVCDFAIGCLCRIDALAEFKKDLVFFGIVLFGIVASFCKGGGGVRIAVGDAVEGREGLPLAVDFKQHILLAKEEPPVGVGQVRVCMVAYDLGKELARFDKLCALAQVVCLPQIHHNGLIAFHNRSFVNGAARFTPCA